MTNRITDKAKSFFNMIQTIVKLPNQKIKEIALNTVTKNSYFAHPDSVLIAMLANEDSHFRRVGLIKFYQLEEA